MSLYDIIFDWLKSSLFNNTFLLNNNVSVIGLNLSISDYLSHTCSFIIIGLIILFFIKLTIYIFKFFGGLIKW